MRSRGSVSLLVILVMGCEVAPPASLPPEPLVPATTVEAAVRPPPPLDAAPRSRPSPAAPSPTGETVALEARCLAPARVGIVRVGADATLSEELGPIGGSLAVLEGRTALLVAGNRVIETTTGAPLRLARGGATEPVVTSLGRRDSGLLLLVVGDQLVARTPAGLASLATLPGAGWQVTCGPGAVYIHDPAARPGAVHALDDDLRSAKLLELEGGVTAVCATRDGVAVGTPGAVWSVTPTGVNAALVLDGYAPYGLAQDPRTGTLFVSDGEGVLAVVDGVPLPLVDGLGGTLACVDEGEATTLWVLDPARRVMARVAPLDWLRS